MVFIIGGAFQGKLDFVLKEYNIAKNDIFFAGKGEILPDREIICGFHMLVKDWLINGLDPINETIRLIENGNIDIIISDEIGGGIVPVDAFERKWREETGKCSCAVAKKAGRVIRIYAGIPQVIK